MDNKKGEENKKEVDLKQEAVHKTSCTTGEADKETSMSSLDQRWRSPLGGNDRNVESSSTEPKTDDELADKVLYGPERTTRRLPVFKETCPDD